MIDYHVHERHSRDAATAFIPEYIAVAEAQRISEIAFTTHLITVGPDVDISIKEAEIPEYIEEIRSAQNSTKVRLLAGLEVDYFPRQERHLESIIKDHDFDFILGSTHYINGVDIGSRTQAEGFFQGRAIRKAADEYYATWKRAVESGLFDVMAHPDYWRKYLHFYGKNADWGDYGSVVIEALESASHEGVGIEVNTAGVRAGTGHFYPLQEFLVAAHEVGITTVTVGSDSHIAGTLGDHINEAIKQIKAAGFTHLTTFKARSKTLVPIGTLLRKSR
jgi:histidinol-phosphatase (PHP family)